jgi:hypothetical protein
VLEIDPSMQSAIQPKIRLPKEIHDRQKKMKEEMMGTQHFPPRLCY